MGGIQTSRRTSKRCPQYYNIEYRFTMNNKTSTLYRKYNKAMGGDKRSYKRLKAAHIAAPRPIKARMTSLMRKTLDSK